MERHILFLLSARNLINFAECLCYILSKKSVPVYGRAQKGVMSRMETTDIVIHKGEKEERYQLYVEDYVISYLKNYGTEDYRNIFFYGTKERREKKYYIYGAGTQKQISFFSRYELLDEIKCRYATDTPVFYVKEDSEIYELAGYYIFYKNNEAMQSYMIEQRNDKGTIEKAQTRTGAQIKNGPYIPPASQTKSKSERKTKDKNGLMAAQLSAIFVILAAIVINTTNSYTKLEDLNEAAVEVFFAMENQEASEKADSSENMTETETVAATRPEEAVTPEVQLDGTTLRLTELDEKFEEENQMAKQEEMENTAKAADDGSETKEENDTAEAEVSVMEEIAPSEQAFARNFAEYYQIEKGDTLNKISIKIYGDTSKVNEICELNKITNPDNIKYGQKILLP